MSIFHNLRNEYLENIAREILAWRSSGEKRYPNIADGSNPASVYFAEKIVEQIGYKLAETPPTEQTAGSKFTKLTRQFIEGAFGKLRHLRPGEWNFTDRQPKRLIAKYDQYQHLNLIEELCEANSQIASVFGRSYIVKPDIVLGRMPISDDLVNTNENLIGINDKIAILTPLRVANQLRDVEGTESTSSPMQKMILHATISCKWTMRNDRAQNARTEALNLIRNRKGRTPHIVVVTMEPLPSRLVAIALGTGDIDCTYHAALHELLKAAEEGPYPDSMDLLQGMVVGRRLRDISDLPFDLAI